MQSLGLPLLGLLRTALVAAAFSVVLAAPHPTHSAEPFSDDPLTPVAHDLEAGSVRSESVVGIFGNDDRISVSQTTAAPYSSVVFMITEWRDGSLSSPSSTFARPSSTRVSSLKEQ